jgi:hypothetical protein
MPPAGASRRSAGAVSKNSRAGPRSLRCTVIRWVSWSCTTEPARRLGAAAYSYAFSKRTEGAVVYRHLKNGARTTRFGIGFETPTVGASRSALGLNLRHRFQHKNDRQPRTGHPRAPVFWFRVSAVDAPATWFEGNCRMSYNARMKQQVSLREANQHLSRYVAAVERGGGGRHHAQGPAGRQDRARCRPARPYPVAGAGVEADQGRRGPPRHRPSAAGRPA